MTERSDIAASMPAVARKLLGDPNKAMSSGSELRWGSRGSLAVDLQKGTWFDHEAGQGGGVLDLIRRERKCSIADALQWLNGEGEHVPIVREVSNPAPKKDNRPYALRLWAESAPIGGTLAEAYLRRRGLAVAIPADLRFHGNCPMRDDAGEAVMMPAMIAAVRSFVDGKVVGVHRTGLRPDATKARKMMLGPCSEGAIMLSGRPDIDGPLGICEGIETGLAVIEAGRPPVWALGSSSGIASFPVIGGISHLSIWADADREGSPAALAVQSCARRWVADGVKTLIYRPKVAGTDFLDELLAFRAGQIERGGAK